MSAFRHLVDPLSDKVYQCLAEMNFLPDELMRIYPSMDVDTDDEADDD